MERMTPTEPPRLQILGPLRVWRDGAEQAAGPRQQAYLLAVLLAQAGRPVTVAELIDLIWAEDVPASAVNILQKYVGALRRLLEPSLGLREPGSYMPRRADGYLFTAGPRTLDVVLFRELVGTARARSGEQRFDAALDAYVRAVGLWQGPAGDGLARTPAAAATFTALDGEFFDACVAATGLAIRLGRSERVISPLRLAARMAPLDELVQASRVSALAAAGRTAEALSVFQEVRGRLATELGVDPGPALREAQMRVLRPAADQPVPAASRMVGRVEELSVVRVVVEAALAGRTGMVLVEGAAGLGKSHLLEEAGAEASRRGALVVWGRCLEGNSVPSMWPWIEVFGTLAREHRLVGELGRLSSAGDVADSQVLPDRGAQFRLFEEATALVGRAAAQRAVVLFMDDLQWADSASLLLFGHLIARLPAGTAVIGAFRDRAPIPGPDLARMLAAASRLPRHRRIRLGPLDPAGVAELVRRETGQQPGLGAIGHLHARTGGNPFFVRELSRLLAGGGPISEAVAAGAAIPATVRDIVRDRMTGLDDVARNLLLIAALIGREVDLALLAHSSGLDPVACLDHLERLEQAGLIEPVAGKAYSFRFPHDLVREAVVDRTAPARSAPIHLMVADVLERAATGESPQAERLAHHLWAAGPLADPARTAGAFLRAGRRAAAKLALDAAAGHLRLAVHMARAAAAPELELTALSSFVAVDAMRAGYVGSAVDLLERAEHLARGLGREREAAELLFSRWAAHAQGMRLAEAGRLARQLLDQGETSGEEIVRAYGRYSWGIHQWGAGHIGEAFRYLSPALPDDRPKDSPEPLRRDLRLISAGMLAMVTALHGDVGAAWQQLDTMEANVGNDPYAVTVWASYAARTAALIGDPGPARRAAERGVAADPAFSFVYLGTYQRLAGHWARAVTGDDPVGAAGEAARLIAATLAEPPRSDLATWYGLLAEMWLAAGRLDEAGAALARADQALDRYGQRYAEGLLLMIRARLLEARGEPAATVEAVTGRARAVSAAGEAHLFAGRAAAPVA